MPRGTRGLVRFSMIFKTAKSLNGSLPATDAVYLFPSVKVTSKTLALLTTWLLVIMCPFVSYIKPEPNAVTFWPSPGLDGSAGGAGTLLVIWTTEFCTPSNIELRWRLCKLNKSTTWEPLLAVLDVLEALRVLEA